MQSANQVPDAAGTAPPRANVHGHLLWAGCDVVELAERYGTPLYVFDEGIIRDRCRAYHAGFAGYTGGVAVAYAAKAILTRAIARLMALEGMHLDIVSGGELHVALHGGFPAERMVMHGNNKTASELAMAVAVGVGRIVVDNVHELDLLRRVTERRRDGARQRVLLRVAPGIEAHTHDYIRTGSQDSKFGFDLQSGQVTEAAMRVAATSGLELVGLHAHIGSQILDVAAIQPLVQTMLDLVVDIRRHVPGVAAELNLGGGLGIQYRDEQALPPAEFVGAIVQAVRDGCAGRGLPLPRIMVEPGRSIVGDAAVALYRVGAQKRVPGLMPYIALDGGMGDNIRPALYGAEYAAVLANRRVPADAVLEPVHLVGRYCESGDFLAKAIPLPPLEAGDLIAIPAAGAYQYPMSSNYNLVPKPCVLLASAGEAHVMVKRETYEDLLARDRLPAHLE